MAPVINRDTLVPLGVAASVGTAFVLGAFWIKDALTILDRRLDSEMFGLRGQIAEMRAELEVSNRTQMEVWSAQEMEIFALRLRIDNPAINVPDIRTIRSRK